jgi:hypothetical protein
VTAIPAISCCCGGDQEPPLPVGLYVKAYAQYSCKRTHIHQKVGTSNYTFPQGYVTGATQIITTTQGPYLCNEGQPDEYEESCIDVSGKVANPEAGPPGGGCYFSMIVSEAEPLHQRIKARVRQQAVVCGAQNYGNCREPGPAINQQDVPECECIESLGSGIQIPTSARASCECWSYPCSIPGIPQPCTPCPEPDPLCSCGSMVYPGGPPVMGGASYSFVAESTTEYDQTFHFVPSTTTLPTYFTATYNFKFPTTQGGTQYVSATGSRRELRERYVPPEGGFATLQFPETRCIACCKGEPTGPPITGGYIDFFNESQYNTDFYIVINAAGANWTVSCNGSQIVLVKNGTESYSVSLQQTISAIRAGIAATTSNQVGTQAGNMPAGAYGQPAKTSGVLSLATVQRIYFRRIGDPFEDYQTKFARYAMSNFGPVWGTANRSSFQGTDLQFAQGFSAQHPYPCPNNASAFADDLLQSGFGCPAIPSAGAGAPPNPVPGCDTGNVCQAGSDIRQVVRAATLVPFGAPGQEFEYSDYGCRDSCDTPCSSVQCQGGARLDCEKSATILPPAGWYNWIACMGQGQQHEPIQPTGGILCTPQYGCGNTCVEICPGSKQPLFLTAPPSIHGRFKYAWSLRRIV